MNIHTQVNNCFHTYKLNKKMFEQKIGAKNWQEIRLVLSHTFIIKSRFVLVIISDLNRLQITVKAFAMTVSVFPNTKIGTWKWAWSSNAFQIRFSIKIISTRNRNYIIKFLWKICQQIWTWSRLHIGKLSKFVSISFIARLQTTRIPAN